MKRLFKKTIVTGAILLTAASSATITLDSISSNTYVKSYHADNYFADTYTGTVSIKGTDRAMAGYTRSSQNDEEYRITKLDYPKESRITYDVQGDMTVKSVFSGGKDDSQVRVDTVTVEDKWNDGEKTQVYGLVVLKPANY